VPEHLREGWRDEEAAFVHHVIWQLQGGKETCAKKAV
jgi:hypothetical protein